MWGGVAHFFFQAGYLLNSPSSSRFTLSSSRWSWRRATPLLHTSITPWPPHPEICPGCSENKDWCNKQWIKGIVGHLAGVCRVTTPCPGDHVQTLQWWELRVERAHESWWVACAIHFFQWMLCVSQEPFFRLGRPIHHVLSILTPSPCMHVSCLLWPEIAIISPRICLPPVFALTDELPASHSACKHTEISSRSVQRLWDGSKASARCLLSYGPINWFLF